MTEPAPRSGSRAAEVRVKFQAPAANSWVVPRVRLRERLRELVGRYRVVWVVGSAGSGKTTAVADAIVHAEGAPVGWLTLDPSDAAPGRLLAHLEETLGLVAGGVAPAATRALAAGIPHVEAASLLAAELTGPHSSTTLVVDEVEHLADASAAAATLAAFLRAAPAGVRAVLVSRRSIPLHLGGTLDVGGVGRLDEADLALSVDEASRIMAGLEHVDVDPATAVEATGGWMAGVLFEAWRSPEHTHGDGGESDALSGYLATEIMADLSAEQRWFLTATSVLTTVTAPAATVLGVPLAGQTLATLRGRFLPVWISDDGAQLRCHPRFRQYLRRRLDESGDLAVEVLRRHGRELLGRGRAEDAVEVLLAAGDVDEATHAAEQGAPRALHRGDVSVVESWLTRLDPNAVTGSLGLTRAELTVAIEREAWARGAVVADRLLALRTSDPAAPPLEPGLAGAIGACFVHVGRPDDARRAVDLAAPGTARDTWRIALALDDAVAPDHYRDRPTDCGEVVDGMLHRFDLMHGRLDRLVDGVPAPWAASRSSRVAGLRAAGRLHEAEELLEEWPHPDTSPALSRIRVELLVDLGRTDDALATLERAGGLARASSSYCVQLHRLLEASVALRLLGDVGRARRALADVVADPTSRQHRRVVEQLSLWRGLADLLSHDDDAAVQHLTRALDVMQRWDRQLLVPAAGVYLAEAAWRTGLENEADRAADAAMAAAQVQGSDHLLTQALREFPMVLSRRLDADLEPDRHWLRAGRLVLDRPVVGAGSRPVRTDGPAVRVHEFGRPRIEVDGSVVDPHLTRSVELLAHLAAHGGQSGKAAVLNDLFGGRTDDAARAYLRRALAKLRAAVDEGCVRTDGDELTWALGPLLSDAADFEVAAAETRRLRGAGRLAAVHRALASVEGVYLPESGSTWVEERRASLALAVEELHLDAAETAFELGDLLTAQRHLEHLLPVAPYRESAWRLAMRVAGSLGQDDRVLELFRGCSQRLAELPAAPSGATTRLLEQLRR